MDLLEDYCSVSFVVTSHTQVVEAALVFLTLLHLDLLTEQLRSYFANTSLLYLDMQLLGWSLLLLEMHVYPSDLSPSVRSCSEVFLSSYF